MKVIMLWLCVSLLAMGHGVYAAALAESSHEVRPEKGTVGDVLTYRIYVRHRSDIGLEPPVVGNKLGPFEVLSSGMSQSVSGDDRVYEFKYRIAVYNVGMFFVPSRNIVFHTSDGPVHNPLPALPVLIQSVLPADASDIRPVTPMMSLPVSRLPYFFFIAIPALVLVLTGVFLYGRRRRFVKPAEERSLTPYEEVCEGLKVLSGTRPEGPEGIAAYYDRLTDILRRYFGALLGEKMMEMTTSEVLSVCRNAMTPEIYDRIRKVFENADMAKFAKKVPSAQDNRHAVEEALDVVKRLHEEQARQGAPV